MTRGVTRPAARTRIATKIETRLNSLNARSGLAAQNVDANVQAANSASRATVTVVRLDGTWRGSTPKATPTMIEIQSAMPTVVRAVRPYPPSAKARTNYRPADGECHGEA